jgi:hypothetical protein
MGHPEQEEKNENQQPETTYGETHMILNLSPSRMNVTQPFGLDDRRESTLTPQIPTGPRTRPPHLHHIEPAP